MEDKVQYVKMHNNNDFLKYLHFPGKWFPFHFSLRWWNETNSQDTKR